MYWSVVRPAKGFRSMRQKDFLTDPRNNLFKDYARFLEEFEPKAFLFEKTSRHVGLLSLGDGKVLDRILGELVVSIITSPSRFFFAAHYGVPQERWRLHTCRLQVWRSFRSTAGEPTHYAAGRANFRGGGGVLTLQLTESDKEPPFASRDSWRGDWRSSSPCNGRGRRNNRLYPRQN